MTTSPTDAGASRCRLCGCVAAVHPTAAYCAACGHPSEAHLEPSPSEGWPGSPGVEEDAETWEASGHFQSVKRLTSWLLFLSLFAGLGFGVLIGVGVAESIADPTRSVFVGAIAGLIAAAVAVTPYFVFVALLELLASIREDISWITQFLHDRSGGST